MPNDEGLRLALLTDSEATLRQVRDLLSDFAPAPEHASSEVDGAGSEFDDPSEAIAELSRLVSVTRAEITDALVGVRSVRESLEVGDDASPADVPARAAELLDELERRMTRLSHLLGT